MKLEIVLRIHDGKNIHGNKPRYIDIPKKDLIVGCVTSLINSANLVKDVGISFIVLNDHCTKDCISKIHNIFKHSNHPYQLIDLEIPGFNYSALKQFEFCKNSNADLVYSIEDDYLHSPTSIGEMMDAYIDLKDKYELNEVCIFPYDTPQEYHFNVSEKFLITRGRVRHWKSSNWTTQTFMTSPKVFQKHWKHFEKLAKEFKVLPKELKHTIKCENIVWENTTICNVWRDHVPVFHPIPSLALHVQFEKERDPYINHLEWWNKYKVIKGKMLYN
jgi:hypothetical protein